MQDEMTDANTAQDLQIRTTLKQYTRFRRVAASFRNYHQALKEILDVYERFGNATRMPRNFMVSSNE